MNEEICKLCQGYGDKFSVCSEVSNKDHLLRFVLEDLSYSNERAVTFYFENGFESANKLKVIIDELYPNKDQKINFLEFASGYGMVTRFLKKILPSAEITACDIHSDAMNFIKDKMGVETVLSESIPENLSLAKKFDVVFALSFFSHMPKETWFRWMKVLISQIENGGFLIFTTHGLVSKEVSLKDTILDEDGFWFNPGSEQKDIEKNEYGTTVVTLQFVLDQVKKLDNCRIVKFKEGFWWGHQDLYIIKVIK